MEMTEKKIYRGGCALNNRPRERKKKYLRANAVAEAGETMVTFTPPPIVLIGTAQQGESLSRRTNRRT